MLTPLAPYQPGPTPNQVAADLMDTVRVHLLPGDSADHHAARCRVALAIHTGQDLTSVLAAEGVKLDN